MNFRTRTGLGAAGWVGLGVDAKSLFSGARRVWKDLVRVGSIFFGNGVKKILWGDIGVGFRWGVEVGLGGKLI